MTSEAPPRASERLPRRMPGWAPRAAAALGPYLAVRAGLLLLAWVGAWTAKQTVVPSVSDYLARWDRWDAVLFRRIAEFGYGGDPALPPDPGLLSFFPGYPLVLRAVHVVVPSWTVAALLISLVAGAVAAVALVRLVEQEGHGRSVGRRAVLLLFVSPYAVFLVAGYSEALFLALALPAWVAARDGHWWAAGLLAGAGSLVRVSGLFVGIALVVLYLTTRRRLHWDVLWLAAPFLAVGGYFAYLYGLTGDWLAWQHAQERGFGRRFTLPWDAYRTTLSAGLDPNQGAEYRFSFFAEIVAVAVGVVLVLVLLRLRRWPEATYVGLSVAALATSTFFFSVTRSSLLWWPLYVLLAAAAVRRPWVAAAYLAVSLPLLAATTLTFTSGLWTA